MEYDSDLPHEWLGRATLSDPKASERLYRPISRTNEQDFANRTTGELGCRRDQRLSNALSRPSTRVMGILGLKTLEIRDEAWHWPSKLCRTGEASRLHWKKAWQWVQRPRRRPPCIWLDFKQTTYVHQAGPASSSDKWDLQNLGSIHRRYFSRLTKTSLSKCRSPVNEGKQ